MKYVSVFSKQTYIVHVFIRVCRSHNCHKRDHKRGEDLERGWERQGDRECVTGKQKQGLSVGSKIPNQREVWWRAV